MDEKLVKSLLQCEQNLENVLTMVRLLKEFNNFGTIDEVSYEAAELIRHTKTQIGVLRTKLESTTTTAGFRVE